MFDEPFRMRRNVMPALALPRSDRNYPYQAVIAGHRAEYMEPLLQNTPSPYLLPAQTMSYDLFVNPNARAANPGESTTPQDSYGNPRKQRCY